MRFADSDSDETATSTSDTTESSAGGQTDKEISDVDLKEDRFRVDRRKLEQMLQGETLVSNGQTAEDFFHRIMEDTNTQISWPSKLKVGAKSKKDPHIKITGDPENVTSAREKVLEVLDTKRNRVTLKMDVSFTDHSHIIGKGGHSIQQVMEDTGCHIHFPDSNRNSIGEKSNQVSIAGLPSGVEKARCRIRDLLPMVLTFDLPMSSGFLQPLADVSSPTIQMIQQRHGFTVTFRPKQRLTTVVVRGSRRLFPQLRQGVITLMEYLTGNPGTMLPVNLSVEVAPQHHAFVMGRGNSNVASISRETGASLTFPDPSLFSGFNTNPMSLQVPQQANLQPRKSTVVISGHIDGVCAAWQELMGCLPLVLMFDLKEGQELDTAQVTRLMDQLNINIVIRPKPKQNTKCLLVRGAERDSRLLFEVRRQLLVVDPAEEPLPLCCQKHADTPYSALQGTLPGVGGNPFENSKESITEIITKDPSLPMINNFNQFNNNYSSGLPEFQHQTHSQVMPLPQQILNNSDALTGGPGVPNAGNYPLLPWLLNQLSNNPSSIYNALLQAHMSDMALASILSRSIKDFSRGPPLSDQASCSGSSGQASSMSSPNISPCESPIFMSGNALGSTASHSSSCSGSLDSLAGEKESFSSGPSWNNPYWLGSHSNSGNSEPYSDLSDTSMMSVSSYEQQSSMSMQSNTSAASTSQIPSQAVFQPRITQNQGRPIVAALANSLSNSNLNSDKASLKGVGSVGCERRSRDSGTAACSLADYSLKKLQAVQAIQKPVSSGARVPTDVWSGYGFSKTLPEDLLRSRLQESRVLHHRVDTIPEMENGNQEDNWFSQTSTMQENFPENKRTYNAVSVDTGVPSFSCSNYFDNNLFPLDLTKEIKDLTNLLSLLSLEKYSEVFQQQQVDLATFLTLTDRDLQELSIPFFARRKMLKAISELNLHGENSLGRQQQFQPAPGAERRAMFARSMRPEFTNTLNHDWYTQNTQHLPCDSASD